MLQVLQPYHTFFLQNSWTVKLLASGKWAELSMKQLMKVHVNGGVENASLFNCC
jgi:hypothetical protein